MSNAVTEPKQPQDRKTKASPAVRGTPALEDHPEGWDLLKPFEKIPAWDQMDLIASIVPMKNVVSGKWASNDPRGLRAMASIARALLPCVHDEDEYIEFSSGQGGIQRAVSLAMEFAAQLGESERSTIS